MLTSGCTRAISRLAIRSSGSEESEGPSTPCPTAARSGAIGRGSSGSGPLRVRSAVFRRGTRRGSGCGSPTGRRPHPRRRDQAPGDRGPGAFVPVDASHDQDRRLTRGIPQVERDDGTTQHGMSEHHPADDGRSLRRPLPREGAEPLSGRRAWMPTRDSGTSRIEATMNQRVHRPPITPPSSDVVSPRRHHQQASTAVLLDVVGRHGEPFSTNELCPRPYSGRMEIGDVLEQGTLGFFWPMAETFAELEDIPSGPSSMSRMDRSRCARREPDRISPARSRSADGRSQQHSSGLAAEEALYLEVVDSGRSTRFGGRAPRGSAPRRRHHGRRRAGGSPSDLLH